MTLESFTRLLGDMFAVYIKTKSFHWHVSGPHFRDYHLLLGAQAEQIVVTTDAMAERVRKVDGTTIRSIGQIARFQHARDNDEADVRPAHMLKELRKDNELLVTKMRGAARALRRKGRPCRSESSRELERRRRTESLVSLGDNQA